MTDRADSPIGPKGTRTGDVIVAEGTRWLVMRVEAPRREVVCALLGGSHALRRFRARRIERVEVLCEGPR